MAEHGESQMGEVIKLIANDGQEFILEVIYAELSEFIKYTLATESVESNKSDVSRNLLFFSFPNLKIFSSVERRKILLSSRMSYYALHFVIHLIFN